MNTVEQLAMNLADAIRHSERAGENVYYALDNLRKAEGEQRDAQETATKAREALWAHIQMMAESLVSQRSAN